MKKIGYILAAIYAVFSLSITSFALPELIQGAEDAVDTVASDAEDILGGGSDGSDTQADEPDALGSDTTADDPAGAGPDVTTSDEPTGTSAGITTTPPTNVSNAGSTNNPSTGAGALLGVTAIGMAAAGLTAAATRKRK